MAHRPQPSQVTWFHRHPKKTLFLITGIFLLVGLFATESVLGYINRKKGISLDTDSRYIVLREFPPLTKMMLPIPPDARRYTEDPARLSQKFKIYADDDGFMMPSKILPGRIFPWSSWAAPPPPICLSGRRTAFLIWREEFWKKQRAGKSILTTGGIRGIIP